MDSIGEMERTIIDGMEQAARTQPPFLDLLDAELKHVSTIEEGMRLLGPRVHAAVRANMQEGYLRQIETCMAIVAATRRLLRTIGTVDAQDEG